MSPKKTKSKATVKKAAPKKMKKMKKKSGSAKKPARPTSRRPATKKAKAAPSARPAAKAKAAPPARPAAKAKTAAPDRGKAAKGGKVRLSVKVRMAAPAEQAKSGPAPTSSAKPKSSRRSRRTTLIRRGPDGEILAPGELLLPGGPRANEEIVYLFRGCMAAERPVPEEAVNEVFQKRGLPEAPGERDELVRAIGWAKERFEEGDIDPIIPSRTNLRRTFQGVVDRARQRRREIGAFLRGLDMGHTETSHMDAHGEASLQSLMEWAARLENLVENLTETDESNQGHYVQFHRVLDQLESTTEALMLDVEQTLRRQRDRLRR